MNVQAAPQADCAPIDARALRRAFGQFATGVTIVTTRTPEGQTVGLTVNSFSSVSIDPPLVLWSLSKRSPNLQLFCDAPHFCINVLAEHQHEIASQFAKPLPDKFAGIEVVDGACGGPLLADAVAHGARVDEDDDVVLGRFDQLDDLVQHELLDLGVVARRLEVQGREEPLLGDVPVHEVGGEHQVGGLCLWCGLT